MANQLFRPSISVPSNIAEGNGRTHVGEYAYHVSMARRSLLEVESILLLAIAPRGLGTRTLLLAGDVR